MKNGIKKNIVLNFVYQFLLIVISIFIISYTSNVLGKDAIGKYSFSQTLNKYFVLFAALGFGLYGQREIARFRNDIRKQSILFWEINLCRFFFVALFLVINYVLIFCGLFGGYSNLMLILSMNIIVVAFDMTFFFFGNEEFAKVILVNILVKIFSVIGIFVFVKKPEDVWIYTLLVASVTFISNLIICCFLKNKLVKVKFNELKPFRHLKQVLLLALPGLAINLYGLIDNSLIGIITRSDVENGYYAQAEKIINKIITLISCISLVMLPRNTHEMSRGNLDQFKKNNYHAIHFIWLLGLPLFGGVVVTVGNFVPWFLGIGFTKSIAIVQVLSLLIVFMGISTVIGEHYLLPSKNDKKYVSAVLIGVAVSFIVNIPLICFWGSLGAAITTVLSAFVIMVVMLCMVAKEVSLKKIFVSMLKPLVATVIMCLAILPLTMILTPGVSHTFIIIAVGIIIYVISILLLRDQLVVSYLQSFRYFKKSKKGKITQMEEGKEKIGIYDENMNELAEKIQSHEGE